MNWKTWAPFQSKVLKEIREHMTEEEKKDMFARSAIYGIWCALTFAIPVSVIATYQTKLTILIAGVLIVIHLVGIPIWLKKQEQFLYSTKWAKSKGYK